MPQQRRYKNPPIEEALCEFRFKSDQDWDSTIPGKFHIELTEEYGGRPQEFRGMGWEWNAQERHLKLNEGLARVHLLNDDGTRMIGVGPGVLSAHMLRPYHSPVLSNASGWGEFRTRLEHALKVYWKVVQPVGVQRVGVRYINKILIPRNELKPGDYLRCALPRVVDLPSSLNNSVSRSEYNYPDGIRLILSQRSTEGPENHYEYLLDIDVIWEGQESVSQEEAMKLAGDLRTRERMVFESVITDKARELFDAS